VDHPAFDDTNQADRRSGSSFARLAASGRPPVDRILLDLAGEFGPADTQGALLIVALGRDGGFAPGAPRVEGLILDRVLRDRRGIRRCWPPSTTRWLAARAFGCRCSRVAATGLSASRRPGELLLVAPSPLSTRPHGVLGELCRLFRALGHQSRLAHALRLRDLLPVPRGLGQSLGEEQES
jgi:hypothetical protein